MKRTLLGVLLLLLLAALAAPALVGQIARSTQNNLIREQLGENGKMPQPHSTRPGWLQSSTQWLLPQTISPALLEHHFHHGPWLGEHHWGWLRGRLSLSAVEAGSDEKDQVWLNYLLGFAGDLQAHGEAAGFRVEQNGVYAELTNANVGIKHQADASALDLSLQSLDMSNERGTLQLQGGSLGLSVRSQAESRGIDLQLSLQQLQLADRKRRSLSAIPATLTLRARDTDAGGELELNLVLQQLQWAGLANAEGQAAVVLERIDLGSLQRILAAARHTGTEELDQAQQQQRVTAALLSELPVLAQRRAELRLRAWQIDSIEGRARLDARLSLQPPQRMALGSGWLTSMIDMELAAAIDDGLLEHLLDNTDPDLLHASLQRVLHHALQERWLLMERGAWRLRASFRDSAWQTGLAGSPSS